MTSRSRRFASIWATSSFVSPLKESPIGDGLIALTEPMFAMMLAFTASKPACPYLSYICDEQGSLAFVQLLERSKLSYGLAGENLARSKDEGADVIDRIQDALMKSLGSNELSVEGHRTLFVSAGYSDVEMFEDRKKGWVCGVGRVPATGA